MSSPPADKMGEEEDLISFSPTKPSTANARKDELHGVSLYLLAKSQEQNSPNGKKMPASNATRSTKADDMSDGGEDDDLTYHQRLLDDDGFCAPQNPANSSDSSTGGCSDTSSTPSVITQGRLADPFVDSNTVSPVLSPVSPAYMPPYHDYGCVVTIDDLPSDITIGDILCRIQTGELWNVMLRELPLPAQGSSATIIFKDARGAAEFKDISHSFDDMWKFHVHNGDSEWTQHARVEHIPNLVTKAILNNPEDSGALEVRRFGYDDEATRCLCIENCAFEIIPEIWGALRLQENLNSPHYAHSLEDIWVNDFKSAENGRIVSATIHIWFTCEALATAMLTTAHSSLRRLPRCDWVHRLTYERDPCEQNRPYESFFRPSDDPGFAWNSNPSQSLLHAFKAGTIDTLFQTWREISSEVKKAQAPSEDPKGGLDPFEKVNELLRCNAYVSALFDATWKYPPSTAYSPGTLARATEDMYDLQVECRDIPNDNSVSVRPQPETETELSEPLQPQSQAETRDAETETELSEPLQPQSQAETRDAESPLDAMRSPGWPPGRSGYSVSVAEYEACDDAQLAAMGTVFYQPPEGHNSFKWYGRGT